MQPTGRISETCVPVLCLYLLSYRDSVHFPPTGLLAAWLAWPQLAPNFVPRPPAHWIDGIVPIFLNNLICGDVILKGRYFPSLLAGWVAGWRGWRGWLAWLAGWLAAWLVGSQLARRSHNKHIAQHELQENLDFAARLEIYLLQVCSRNTQVYCAYLSNRCQFYLRN